MALFYDYEVDPITRAVTVSEEGREIGEASAANGAQLDYFLELLDEGATPEEAADDSGAIYVAH